MQIVKYASEHILKMISLQKKSSNTNYRPIKYSITVEKNNRLVIYNTLTLEIIELDEKEARNFISKEFDNLDYLIEHWFLVPAGFDDYAFYNNLLNIHKMMIRDKSIYHFTILTTTDCNAHCFYCIEHGSGRYPMTQDTAHGVADYISKVSLGKEVVLKWFGGEPLYNHECISIICSDLSQKGILFKSYIVTNGYLFNADIAKIAKDEWNIKNAQITLDGTSEVYNRIKAYNNGDPNPFETVMINIQNLLNNNISVQIRLNLGEKNKEDLFELVKYLANRFGDKITVYTALLYDKKGIDYNQKNKMMLSELIMAQIELDNLIASYNMSSKFREHDKLRINACSADNDNAVIILPDGSLGKCDFYITRGNEYLIGNIYDGIINHDVAKLFKKRNIISGLCESCQLLPLCYKIDKCPVSTSEYCDSQIRDYKIGLYQKQLEEFKK